MTETKADRTDETVAVKTTFWGLSRVIAVSVAVAIIAAVATVAAISAYETEKTSKAAFDKSAASISELMAGAVGGGVKFGKAEILLEQFSSFLDTHQDMARYAGAFKSKGGVVAESGAAPDVAAALAAEAAASGEVKLGPNGLIRAVPVRFGKKNSVVGALVIAWSEDARRAALQDSLMMVAAVGAGVALVFGLLAAALLRPLLSQPLDQLTRSVARLADGEDAPIAGVRRRDEIGSLARSLRAIYEAGVDAARVRSALDGSSARLMIADAERRIVYASPALTALLEGDDAGRRALQATDADGVARFDASIWPQEAAALAEASAAARADHVKLGALSLQLNANPILAADGARLGAVIEWRDLTAELRLQSEIDAVVAAVAAGDFSRRVDARAGDGPLGAVAEKLNGVCAVTAAFVSDMEMAAQALADGDLRPRAMAAHQGRFRDVADCVARAAARLGAVITDVQSAEAAMRQAIREVQGGSVDLANRAESQASALEETTATMEEIAASVTANADHAARANQLSEQAKDCSARGPKAVGDAVSAMSEIEKSSAAITEIISVIDSIAFQTNLLALNAAVEAARAGDAGKGFAVVASEVRTLAQRSADAARDIGGLITTSNAKVADGVRLVRATGDALDEILSSNTRVSATISEISSASREQSQGVAEINEALLGMDRTTQENAALAEQSASAAKVLRSEAETLAELIGAFQTEATADPELHRVA